MTYDGDLVDLTNDGFPELVQADAPGPFGTRMVRVLLNNGAAAGTFRFVDATNTWLPSPSFTGDPDDLAHTDLDHDGFIDVAERGSLLATLLFNQNGSTFEAALPLSLGSGSSSVHDVFFLDANHDGYPDLFGADESGISKLFLSQSGSFVDSLPTGSFPPAYSGAAADLNADGVDDFVLAGPNGAQVLLNSVSLPPIFSETPLKIQNGCSTTSTSRTSISMGLWTSSSRASRKPPQIRSRSF